MRDFVGRRLRNGAFALALASVAIAATYFERIMLRDDGFLTGWLLVAAVVLLAAYNLRKKLPFLPLADAAAWLQLHIYVGLLAVLLFFLHVGPMLPSGRLEALLWILFVALMASGVFGLLVSRLVPIRLGERGERIIFERIPVYRARLATEVEALAARSVAETALGTIAAYYTTRLHAYFQRPRNFWRHLAGSKRPVQRISDELQALERYLPPGGRETLAEIEARVLAKDNLDSQYAWQWLLKSWLYVHLPLTYAAILVAAAHVVLVYAFAGSSP